MTTDRAALEKAIDIHSRHLGSCCGDAGRTILAAAQAHLDTLPKVRTTATWQVQYFAHGDPMVDTYRTYHEARGVAAELEGQGFDCVHVVGPVMHCVPS